MILVDLPGIHKIDGFLYGFKAGHQGALGCDQLFQAEVRYRSGYRFPRRGRYSGPK